ncbi:hypothetical protein AOLI_G00129500 [Acnodon oligacanthus]
MPHCAKSAVDMLTCTYSSLRAVPPRHAQQAADSLSALTDSQPTPPGHHSTQLSPTDVVSPVRGGRAARHRAGHTQPGGTKQRRTPVTGDGSRTSARRRKKRRNRFEKELKVAACLSQPFTLPGPAEAPCSSRLALSGSSLARERRSASLGNRRLDPVPHSGVELREGRRGQRIKGGGGGIIAQCEWLQQDRSEAAFTAPDIIS